MSRIKENYKFAKEQYEKIGVDTDKAMKKLDEISVSMHCWQGDDVKGLENPNADLTGGIAVTGAYPGKARNGDELRADISKAFSLIPGKAKLNLHAFYGESDDGNPVDRAEISPRQFEKWLAFAKDKKIGLDFNPTLFSHPKSAHGFTLSSHNEEIRKYWVRHCIASRKIGEYFGKELGKPCVNNIWIADGFKDNPIDRYSYRERLKKSLDEIFAVDIDKKYNLDAVESKVFGIGTESCTIGSSEFYLGYAAKNDVLLTLDSGHFHPTEYISDKISSTLIFVNQLLLHVSRPVRWDSDHVIIYNEDLRNIAEEIVRNDFMDRVHIGLDFFDGSINRIAAWVIGMRNMEKALLGALLEPTEQLRALELEGDYTTRLAMLEELRTYPVGAVWDMYCEMHNVPIGPDWIEETRIYENEILSKR